MTWYVLYTKPRHEKKTALVLAESGYEVYCPTVETRKKWSDRVKKVTEPLFRSYVFVRLDAYDQQQTSVLSLPGAVRFLWWQGMPARVRDHEINAIREFLGFYTQEGATISLKEGQEVTIVSGPLAAWPARVVRVQGQKAILHLHSLGMNITAELPLQYIESSLLPAK
jgi:transcription antitermination factor NusG